MAQLVLHRRAARYFERLDERLKAQLRAKLEELARDPLAMPGVKPMAGEWRGFYRLRHGDLRVIYLFDQSADRVMVGFDAGWNDWECGRRSSVVGGARNGRT